MKTILGFILFTALVFSASFFVMGCGRVVPTVPAQPNGVVSAQAMTPTIIPTITPVGTEYSGGSFTITVDGVSRAYLLYIPSGVPVGAPLVFHCHGSGGTDTAAESGDGWDPVALTNHFAMCYPQAESGTWWGDYLNQYLYNDVKFMVVLAQYLQTTYQLSAVNTFMNGFSNGADFTGLVCLYAGNVFHAGGQQSGCLMKSVADSNPNPTAVPFVMFNGTADTTTSMSGDLDDPVYSPWYSTLAGYNFFAGPHVNKCHSIAETYTAVSGYPNLSVMKATGGLNGNQVWSYEVQGGIHTPDMGAQTGSGWSEPAVIWSFFTQYIK
jgi:poly(3-hydroxybutyrate) depolymerase